MKTKVMVWVVCIGMCCSSCGGGSNGKQVEENEVERIELFSVTVPEECIQVYENSYCRPISAQIDGTNCMVAFSDPLYAIDLIDLQGKQPFRQIALEKEGPNGVNGISGVFYYDNAFVLKTSNGFSKVDKQGNLLSSWSLSDYLSKHPGFSAHYPEKLIIFSFYQILGFDAKEGLVTLPMYKNQKENGQYPARILVLSCKDWQVVDEVEVNYPQQMKQEEWLGCLGEIQALPHGEKVIWNFPASSDVYVYDRKKKTTQTFSIETQYTDGYYRCKNKQDHGLAGGYFMPLRYDATSNTYWRIQQKPMVNPGLAGKGFSVTRLSDDFEKMAEYDMPDEKNISSFTILFGKNSVYFPYIGGEHIEENNIPFYGLSF
ncbi:MAG: DUF4221 domain-containing protein [Mediterranea massiliensis]|nr:DUF4221 domain-containing protein [Mediterranea massiliensis]